MRPQTIEQFFDLLALQYIGYGIAAIAILAAIWLLTAYRGRIAAVGRAIARESAEPYDPETMPETPAASVVVVAGDDATALEELLEKLLEQDYRQPWEIIVVNNGKNEDIKDVVTRIKHQRHLDNLYITFAPPELRNVSRRKLAITLGVKAAHNPVVCLLTEQSRRFSNQWLTRMMAPFANPDVELVLAPALPAVKADKERGGRHRSFMHGADATEWLAAALRGKPWRGHRANMAFRRDMFFRSGGFNGALNLRDGDDDIFVSRVSTPENTAVVMARQAHVRYKHPSSKYEYHNGRAARVYSSRGLGVKARRLAGLSSAMLWTFSVTSLMALMVFIWTGCWWAIAAMAVLILGVWITLTLTWRATLKALNCRRALASLPWRMLRRPVSNCATRARSRRHRNEYHTWG